MTCGVGRFAQVQALEEQQSQDGYQIEEMIGGVAMTVEVYVPDQSPVGFTPSLLALRVCARFQYLAHCFEGCSPELL